MLCFFSLVGQTYKSKLYKSINDTNLKVKQLDWGLHITAYHISSYSFCGSYFFFNLEIVANSNSCCNISILCLIFFAAETIHGRNLFKEGNYMRKYHNFAWQQSDECLTIACQLPKKTAWWLLCDCLTISWWLPDNWWPLY